MTKATIIYRPLTFDVKEIDKSIQSTNAEKNYKNKDITKILI